MKRLIAILAMLTLPQMALAADAGVLVPEPWPEKERVLAQLDVLKTDAVEAGLLTGQPEIKVAARMIACWSTPTASSTRRAFSRENWSAAAVEATPRSPHT